MQDGQASRVSFRQGLGDLAGAVLAYALVAAQLAVQARQVGESPAVVARTGTRAFVQSLGILGTCLKEAPEFASRRRRVPPRTAA